MDNLALVAKALASLLKRQNEDAFVIIEERQTGHFVQFAGSASEMLLLDLPAQALSEQEFDRAVEFFRRLGVAGREHDVLKEPGGAVVGKQFSFDYTFYSVNEAARTALDMFEKIYQLPRDCDLVTTEN